MPTSPKTEASPKKSARLSRAAWWWIGSSVAAVVLAGVVFGAMAYAAPGTNIVRGTTVAGQPVGGMDSLTAIHTLQTKWAAFQQQAFEFQAPGRTMAIVVTADAVTDEDTSIKTIDFDPAASVNAALSFGRRGSFWQRLRERTSGYLGRPHELGMVHVDAASIGSTLQEKFGDLEKPATNATLAFAATDTPNVVPSTNGATFDYGAAVRQARAQAERLDGHLIILPAKPAVPDIVESSALTTLAQSNVDSLLNRAPLTLMYADKTWTINRDQLKKLLGFTGTTDNPRLGFDIPATTAYLATISKEIQVKAQNAKFSIVDGKVQEFQASATGITLDAPATIAAMQHDLIDGGNTSVAVVVTEEQPLTDTVGTNDLGITELVATATTNFKGSPVNRRFNLTYGAKLLNGLLIQPGEEFSLVKALGKIDAAHGWKPELVIKGTAIKPEFGGGLCQVATTTFRVALNAGLPIVERHNHSLRIHYYEPPVGLDATIYEPKPDLRFTNDYKTPLLLQTQVNGNDITFSFYGTKDGRSVDIPTPKVFNKTGIPPTTTVEVDTLKPGEKKCQTPGHPGADAIATYTVTKADGSKVTQTFTSHYRALGVICQVGKKPAPKPAPTVTPAVAPAPADTNTAADITITNQ